MARRPKKVGLKDIRYSGKYILASVIVEGLLLAPKTRVPWNGKEIEIGGIIPMLQKEIASFTRDGVNTVAPKAANKVESLVRQTNLKELLMDRILWFIYDYMEQFTLNSVATSIMDKAGLQMNTKMTGLFRDYLQDVLDSKDDREKLIAGITDFLLNSANTLFAGTSVSLFLTGGLSDNIKRTVSDYVEKGLQTETGAVVIDRILNAVESFETLTLAGFIERNLEMPRPVFEKYLSDLYEKYVGTQMVEKYSDRSLGEELYEKIAGMDYDKVFKDITTNHWRDLIQVTLSAASVGLFFLNASNRAEAKTERKQEKKQKKAVKKETKKSVKAAGKTGGRKAKKAAKKAAKQSAKQAKKRRK